MFGTISFILYCLILSRVTGVADAYPSSHQVKDEVQNNSSLVQCGDQISVFQINLK